MKKLHGSLLLCATFGLAILTFSGPSNGAQQAIKDKSACTKVGGKLQPNPWTDGTYPHLCIYPDKYDKQCQKKLDETAYYDIAARKCVSELLCDLEGIC